MLKITHTRRFARELKKMIKSGKDSKKFKKVAIKLANMERLEARYKEHKLTGNYKGRLECHLEPDWLLIYKIEGDRIVFERTGTHSDLFA